MLWHIDPKQSAVKWKEKPKNLRGIKTCWEQRWKEWTLKRNYKTKWRREKKKKKGAQQPYLGKAGRGLPSLTQHLSPLTLTLQSGHRQTGFPNPCPICRTIQFVAHTTVLYRSDPSSFDLITFFPTIVLSHLPDLTLALSICFPWLRFIRSPGTKAQGGFIHIQPYSGMSLLIVT